MRENKHIEKELLFKNNIKDITSISLDSDYKIENSSLVGNFIISGEYKIHEVSINREKFNFKIPFNIEIDKDIDKKTIKLEITNFVYDYKQDELIVNIDYEILGDRESVLLFDDEESLDEFLNKREVEVIDTRLDEIKNTTERKSIDKIEEKELDTDNKNKIELNDSQNNTRLGNNDNLDDLENKIDIIEPKEEEREQINTNEIINSIDTNNDKFITYKVYKIHENETLESIVIKYHTTIDDLKEYNDLSNLNIGDKIIIPSYE
mgnify:FL=1